MKSKLQQAGVTLSGCGCCTSCHTVKPATDFYPDKAKASGLSSRCKPCDRARLRSIPSDQIERELRKIAAKFPKHTRLIARTAASLAA